MRYKIVTPRDLSNSFFDFTLLSHGKSGHKQFVFNDGVLDSGMFELRMFKERSQYIEASLQIAYLTQITTEKRYEVHPPCQEYFL